LFRKIFILDELTEYKSTSSPFLTAAKEGEAGVGSGGGVATFAIDDASLSRGPCAASSKACCLEFVVDLEDEDESALVIGQSLSGK
jgi:hypothetical protein